MVPAVMLPQRESVLKMHATARFQILTPHAMAHPILPCADCDTPRTSSSEDDRVVKKKKKQMTLEVVEGRISLPHAPSFTKAFLQYDVLDWHHLPLKVPEDTTMKLPIVPPKEEHIADPPEEEHIADPPEEEHIADSPEEENGGDIPKEKVAFVTDERPEAISFIVDTVICYVGTIEEFPDSSSVVPSLTAPLSLVAEEEDEDTAEVELPVLCSSTESISTAASTKENEAILTRDTDRISNDDKMPLSTSSSNQYLTFSSKISYADMAKRTSISPAPVAAAKESPTNQAVKPKKDRPTRRFVPSLGSIVVEKDAAAEEPVVPRKVAPHRAATAPHWLIVTDAPNDDTEAGAFFRTMGIPHQIVKANDPLRHQECQGLYALSGIRHHFPQFFHVDASGIPAFYGTLDAMERQIEDGTFLQHYGGMMNTKDDHSASVQPENESGTLVGGDSSVSPLLLVLISQQSLDRNVKSNQDLACCILDALKIPYTLLDGADPQNHTTRNHLFQISGRRAQYPQFFIIGPEMQFLGDWEAFQSLHETGDLSRHIQQLCASPNTAPVRHASSVVPVMTSSLGSDETASAEKGTAAPTAPAPVKSTGSTSTPPAQAASSHKKSHAAVSSVARSAATPVAPEIVQTEITVYGATSFVAQHALDYFMQVSLTLKGKRTITLAGRNEAKLTGLQKTLTEKMANLVLLDRKSIGQCVFDVFVADCSDATALKQMADRTELIANFAGPYRQYGEQVVAACAQCGTNYIDITGEISWAGQMRQKYSAAAEQSGARIISLCGFDSIPSDMAVFACIDALRKAKKSDVPVDLATTWHSSAGTVNGGTIHSAMGMPLNLRHCFSQPVPFLLDDPLVLAHPRTRFDPDNQPLKNRMAIHEWRNQLPSFDSTLVLGASAPFFMSIVNAKVVQASAVALKYGPHFQYRERFLPVGLDYTRKLGILSIIPALIVQVSVMIGFAVLRTPWIGKFLADWLAPPGSGSPDYICKAGFAKVYAEVATPPSASGNVDKATCFMEFEGDPGNWVTAQCLCESALALTLDRSKLPSRSLDGFGTPAELLGSTLLRRLQATKVRPVKMAIHVRKNVPRRETIVFCGRPLDDL